MRKNGEKPIKGYINKAETKRRKRQNLKDVESYRKHTSYIQPGGGEMMMNASEESWERGAW